MLFVLLAVFGLVPEVLAADNGESWRTTYDMVMRWVNFIILVAVIVKFGRRPLMNFLTGRKEEIAYELRRLEEEKEAVQQKVDEMRREIQDSEARYEQIKERIIAQGRNRKQAIIDEAHRESRVLMESAKNHINNGLRAAKRKIRAEIIDLAVERAMQELPGQVTEQDNRTLVERLIERAAS
jgi:F-type H+-transporting ATPase subunit b